MLCRHCLRGGRLISWCPTLPSIRYSVQRWKRVTVPHGTRLGCGCMCGCMCGCGCVYGCIGVCVCMRVSVCVCIPAQVAMSNIAVRYHRFRDGQV